MAIVLALVIAFQEPTRSDFTLFKLQQRVGAASSVLARRGDTIIVHDTSRLTFLGTSAPLTASLRIAPGGIAYATRGSTSTFTTVDTTISSDGSRFTVAPYPTPGVLERLIARSSARNHREVIGLAPAGQASVTSVGADTVDGNVLQRFAIRGVVWGMMIAWTDREGRLIAAVHGDAELDRMEVIRSGFERHMAVFVRRSVDDGVRMLERLAREVRPEHQGSYALTGARLIDGLGGPAIDDAVVVVAEGRIASAGPRASVRIPRGVRSIDMGGRTIMPGLWDMHGHYEQVEWPAVALAAGVTTVRDAANEFELVTALRDGIAAGRIIGPRMLLAGVIDGGEHPLGVITAATPEEARAVVRRYRDAGFQQIKIYQSLPPALVPVVAEEAHRLGMTVTGHVPTGMNAVQFVEAGADQINHLNFVVSVLRPAPVQGQPPQPVNLESEEARRAIALFVQRGTVIDPSLARGEEFSHWKGHYHLIEPGVALAPPELRAPLQSTGRDSAFAVQAFGRQTRLLSIVNDLRRSGIPIVLGTDLTVPGHSIARELELAVRGGFTPMEAIQAATAVPARAMGLLEESGTIEPGKRADLLILSGDPLADISAVRRVHRVITAGRMYDPAPLWRSGGFEPVPPR